MDKMTMMAGMVAAAASMSDVPRELFSGDGSHSGSKGHVCGVDSGKGKKKQPRNSPCMCGSGLKAKKCCVYVVESH